MRCDRWFLALALGLSVLGLSVIDKPAAAAVISEVDEKLPKAVMKTVKSEYPGALIVGTAREKNEEEETIYEVELLVKGKSIDLLIDEEGEIEEIEKEISPEDLPKAVLKTISKVFHKAKIAKVEEVTGEDDKVLYEIVVVMSKKKTLEVVIAPNGKVIEKMESDDDDKPKAKKKKDKDEDDDDDDKPKAKKKDMDDDDDDDKPKQKDDDDDDDDDDEDDDDVR